MIDFADEPSKNKAGKKVSDPPLLSGITTWTFNVGGIAGVVSAESVPLAIHLIQSNLLVELESVDLIPLPTHHRHVRKIADVG